LRSGVAYYHFFEDGTRLSFNLDDCVANVIPSEKLLGAEFGKLEKFRSWLYRTLRRSTAEMYQAEFNTLESNEERVAWLDRMKKVQEVHAEHTALYLHWQSSMEELARAAASKKTGYH